MSTPPTDIQPILVAHGTRSPQGVNTVAKLADLVHRRIGVTTRVAFVDVLGPSPCEVLDQTPGHALVIPAFLAAGYHVRTDIPRHIMASGHPEVTLCDNLGPDPLLAAVLRDRLRAAGRRRGDAVVMAAAGSSDPLALADVERAGRHLAALIGDEVAVGYVTTATPRVPQVVERVRRTRGGRVFIAPYLLAPGLFHARLSGFGANGVADPLGADPRIAQLIVRRVGQALHAHRPASVRTM